MAFSRVNEAERPRLRADLVALIDRLNGAKDGSMIVPGEYLEVVINKRVVTQN
jgi:hypothetical protein